MALPQGLLLTAGQPAPRDIVAPADRDFVSTIRTAEAREAAREAVPDQYDYTTGNAIAIAAAQQRAFESRVDALDAAFAADVSPEDRAALLDSALAEIDLPEAEAETLKAMEPARWRAVRTEAGRVLDVTMRFEVKDSEVESTKLALADRMAGDLSDDERFLAAALITPLIVGNSSYSADLTTPPASEQRRLCRTSGSMSSRARSSRARATRSEDAELEALEALGLNDGDADLATFAGWFLFAALIVGLLLAWLWRFRPGLWHRNSVPGSRQPPCCSVRRSRSKLGAGRSILTYFLPTAAVGYALLRSSSTRRSRDVVMALIALVAGCRERFVARDRGVRVPRRHGRGL